MLEHSRTSSGEKTLTDIKCEYSRIAYQGLRAKYKEFHSDYILNLDINIPKSKCGSLKIYLGTTQSYEQCILCLLSSNP